MHVVIAGGTGFIGRALSPSLLADGHEVTILSRSEDRSRVAAGARIAVWNGRDVGPWAKTLERADALVNLAGASLAGDGAIPARWNAAYKAKIRDSRLSAGAALMAAMKTLDVPPAVLVQASGVGVYGSWDGDDAPQCAESCPPGDDFLARLAVDWEASTEDADQLGIRRVVIRTGVVLAAHGGALPRMAMPVRVGFGGPLGHGRQMLSWIHLDDEVRAIRFLIEEYTGGGAFNLAAPSPVSNADFGRILAKSLGRPFWLPAPAFAMRLLLGEAAALVLTGQQAQPAELLRAGFRFNYPELPEALAAIYPRAS